jgi:hypothetical protein
MEEDQDQTGADGAERSGGPEADRQTEAQRDAERATDQAMPEDASDAMHGRG